MAVISAVMDMTVQMETGRSFLNAMSLLYINEDKLFNEKRILPAMAAGSILLNFSREKDVLVGTLFILPHIFCQALTCLTVFLHYWLKKRICGPIWCL